MKLKVIREHIAELIELDKAISYGCPLHYQPPYFILKPGNVLSKYEYLTKSTFLNKYGKRKYFDMNAENACEFISFDEAINVASKFKSIDTSKREEFFIIGFAESLVVNMYINDRKKDWQIES